MDGGEKQSCQVSSETVLIAWARKLRLLSTLHGHYRKWSHFEIKMSEAVHPYFKDKTAQSRHVQRAFFTCSGVVVWEIVCCWLSPVNPCCYLRHFRWLVVMEMDMFSCQPLVDGFVYEREIILACPCRSPLRPSSTRSINTTHSRTHARTHTPRHT